MAYDGSADNYEYYYYHEYYCNDCWHRDKPFQCYSMKFIFEYVLYHTCHFILLVVNAMKYDIDVNFLVILLFYDYYCLISCYCLMISIISSL